jgi:hypothetical protein
VKRLLSLVLLLMCSWLSYGQVSYGLAQQMIASPNANYYINYNIAQTGNLIGSATGATAWSESASTFSGFNFPLPGTPQNLSRITAPVIAWNTAHLPTRVRITIRDSAYNGTTLATITKTLPAPVPDSVLNTAYSLYWMDVTLPTSIANVSSHTLWMEADFNGYAAFAYTTGSITAYYTSSTNYLTASATTSFSSSNIVVSLYSTPVTSGFENVSDNGMVYVPTQGLASSFSSFGFAVGNGFKQFNAWQCDLQWSNNVLTPPTFVRMILRDGGSTLPGANPTSGTVLADETVYFTPGSVPWNTPFPVTWFFQNDISTPNYLYWEVLSDSNVGIRSSTSTWKYGTNNVYGTSASIFTEPASVAGSLQNPWFATFYYDRSKMVIAPVSGTPAVSQFGNAQSASIRAPDDVVYHSMPPKVYAASGRETNIFFRNFLRTGLDLSNYRFVVTCSKGSQYEDRWTFTAADGDAGTYAWSCAVYKANVLLTTVSTSLVVKASTVGGSATRQLVTCGDSTTANGIWLAELVNIFSGDSHLSLTTVGHYSVTVNDAGGTSRTVKTDAVSGWTVAKQCYDPASTFQNSQSITAGGGLGGTTTTLASVTGLAVGSYVTFTGGTQETVKITAINTGTKVITHPALAYASHTTCNWFSLATWQTANSITLNSGDWFTIPLGINDVFSLTSDQAVFQRIAQMQDQLQSMINNCLSVQSGLRIGILMTISQPDQNTFGYTYADTQTSWRARRNTQLLREAMLTMFAGQSQVYVLGWHLGLDTAHNYPWTMQAFNARNPIPSATIAPGTISANSVWESSAINCYGALAGIPVSVGPPTNIAAGLTWSAYCSATDTIKLRISNPTGSGIAVTSATWTFLSAASPAFALGNNGVHPANVGYWQSADTMYSIMKGFES